MRLRERREALGYTQKQVAEIVGVDQSQISYYESGAFKPKYPANQKLADLYGCTVEDIMSDPSDSPHNTPPAVP